MVKFVSYDGKYPDLCMGTLVLEIDGKIVNPKGVLMSGGSVTFYNGCADVEVTNGEWELDLPNEYLEFYDDIKKVVNENVPHGCCGGCV